MKCLPLFLLFAHTVFAQSNPPILVKDSTQTSLALLPAFEQATIWEGVRIKTESVFEEKDIVPSFKIKNKEKRRELVTALEGQFQINISESEIRSLKRAGDLADYIFKAQHGAVLFSKTNFQGKVERFATDRKDCDEHFDCLNFIGALIVPKGLTVTLFSQPKFKGEQLVIDATKAEVRIANFFKIAFDGPVSTTDKAVNWREEVRSVRVRGGFQQE